MAVPALAPGLFPTALLRDASAQPVRRDSAAATPRMPDVVVFSSAPFRALADLATSGLRQLATLLPILEQAAAEPDPVPLGHLAKAAGAAAKQVADGHVALLAAGPDRLTAALAEARTPAVPGRAPAAEGVPQALRAFVRQIGANDTVPKQAVPNEALRALARQIGATLPERLDESKSAEPAERWLTEAKHILRRTGDVLERAPLEVPPQAADRVDVAPAAPQPWITLELAAAQAQVTAAWISLDQVSLARNARSAVSTTKLTVQLATATGVLGAIILLVLLGVTISVSSSAAFLLAVAGTGWWALRFARAGRGLALDARR